MFEFQKLLSDETIDESSDKLVILLKVCTINSLFIVFPRMEGAFNYKIVYARIKS